MRFLVLLLSLFALPAEAASPCIWSGSYARCLTTAGLLLRGSSAGVRMLSDPAQPTKYVDLLPPSSAPAAGYVLRLPSAGPSNGDVLYYNGGTGSLDWQVGGYVTSATFTAYQEADPFKAQYADAAATGNIDMGAGNPGTVDGYDCTFGCTLLLPLQTDPSENGLWSVDLSGVWARKTTMPDNLTSTYGAVVSVRAGGTVNGGTLWLSLSTGDGLDVPFVRIPTTPSNAALTASVDVVTDANGKITTNSITGSGNSVRATSPTLTTPNLGTPSAVTLTNGTGLPISTGVSGLGTGVATFLATPSSANLASAVTDETGSGALVFGTSPSLTTPAIGSAGATFAGSSSGTTTVAATAAASGTLTLPAATDTLVGKATTDALTNKDISAATNTYRAATNTQDGAVTISAQNIAGTKTFYDGLKADDDAAAGGASTFNYYREGSTSTTFTFNGSGGTSGSVSLSWVRVGKVVTINIPTGVTGTTGTSSTQFNSNTAVPADIRPAAAINFYASVDSNNTTQSSPGKIAMNSDGTISVRLTANNTAWGNSLANSGLSGPHSITFVVP